MSLLQLERPENLPKQAVAHLHIFGGCRVTHAPGHASRPRFSITQLSCHHGPPIKMQLFLESTRNSILHQLPQENFLNGLLGRIFLLLRSRKLFSVKYFFMLNGCAVGSSPAVSLANRTPCGKQPSAPREKKFEFQCRLLKLGIENPLRGYCRKSGAGISWVTPVPQCVSFSPAGNNKPLTSSLFILIYEGVY